MALKTHSPSKSVTLSVKARDARMRTLSLSSYFIFISKKPTDTHRSWREDHLPPTLPPLLRTPARLFFLTWPAVCRPGPASSSQNVDYLSTYLEKCRHSATASVRLYIIWDATPGGCCLHYKGNTGL